MIISIQLQKWNEIKFVHNFFAQPTSSILRKAFDLTQYIIRYVSYLTSSSKNNLYVILFILPLQDEFG